MNHPFSGVLVRYLMRQHSPSENLSKSSVENITHFDPKKPAAASENETRPDELHVNLWEVRDPSVLDLGIMIGDWKSVKAVCVDLPWNIAEDNVEDLGARLNSERTVAAIFNEVVNYSSNADQNYSKIKILPSDVADSTAAGIEATKSFFIFRLPTSSFSVASTNISHSLSSCRLQVNLPEPTELQNEENHPLYLRFRINKVPRSIYSSTFQLADRNLLSSSTKTRIIDFRINVRRGIPDDLFNGNVKLKFPNFGKIHFFLTIGREQICDFESQNFVGCRSLVDEQIWNGYLQAKSSAKPVEATRNFLGYQWTEAVKDKVIKTGPAGVKDLVVMGRFSSHTSNVLKTIKFVFFGLVFGMIGNGMWEIAKPGGNYIIGTPDTARGTYVLLGGLLLVSILCTLPWDFPNFWRPKLRTIISRFTRLLSD